MIFLDLFHNQLISLNFANGYLQIADWCINQLTFIIYSTINLFIKYLWNKF